MKDINPIGLNEADGYAVEGVGLGIEGNDVFIEGGGYIVNLNPASI